MLNNKVYILKQKYQIDITTNIDDKELIEISNLKDFIIKRINVNGWLTTGVLK